MPALTERPAKMSYVLRVSSPPALREQLQIAVALMQGAAALAAALRHGGVAGTLWQDDA